jgi:cytoskeletal protein RodZ
VSIGEDLAQARCRAGLSVTEVSQRTRIRETLIRGIEHDDYAACGGDFYTRGHIRAIARAVEVDPGPLIGAYDATHQVPQPVTAPSLFRPSAEPARNRPRHRGAWAVLLGLVLAAGIGFAVYHLVTGSHHSPTAPGAAAAGLHRPLHRHVTRRAAASPSAPTAQKIVIRLTAREDCWVEFTTPRGGYLSQSIVVGGASKRWVFRRAVDMRLGNPGGVSLRVDGVHALPSGTVNPITLRLRRHGKVSS